MSDRLAQQKIIELDLEQRFVLSPSKRGVF